MIQRMKLDIFIERRRKRYQEFRDKRDLGIKEEEEDISKVIIS
jgi:hypothetical protein